MEPSSEPPSDPASGPSSDPPSDPPSEPSSGRSPDPPAVGWCLLAFAGLVLAMSVVGFWLVGLWLVPADFAPGGAGADATTPGELGAVDPTILVAQSAVLLLAAVLAGIGLLALFHHRRAEALGFYLRAEAVGETLKGLLLGTAVAGAVVVALALLGGAAWIDDGGGLGGLALEGLGALAFLALPAAAEEALFRGYPLQVLARAWGPLPALGISALGFGLLHFANPGMTVLALGNLVGAGMFLGAVYLRTASLWWATGAHLGWNWALGYGADLPVSGLELLDTPLWTGIARGAQWLGGGPFGPEGSVITTLVFFGATAVVWKAGWLGLGDAARESDPLIRASMENRA